MQSESENWSSNSSAASTALNSPDNLYFDKNFQEQKKSVEEDKRQYNKEGYENLLSYLEECSWLITELKAQKKVVAARVQELKKKQKKFLVNFVNRNEKYSDYQVRIKQEINVLRHSLQGLKKGSPTGDQTITDLNQRYLQLEIENQQLQQQLLTLETNYATLQKKNKYYPVRVRKISAGLGGLGILSVSVYYLQSKGKLQQMFSLLKKINFFGKKKKYKR